MSKTINKAKLDEAIELTRQYYFNDYDEDVLKQMLAAGRAVEKAAGLRLHTMADLIGSIIGSTCLKPNCTNEDIYKVLEVLGWSVE